MKFRINTEDNQPVSNWSGGKTKELAIFPEGSSYLDRDFIWRLSTASSDREESSFSKLEGFDRILMVLEGDVVLAHGQERSVHLGRMEQDSFDGGIKTKCFGRLEKDYNLIMARGCEGSLEVVKLTDDAKAMDISDDAKAIAPRPEDIESRAASSEIYRSYGAFCLDGYAVVSCGERSEMIRPGSQAVIDLLPGEEDTPKIMGEGQCVLSEVAFETEKSDTDMFESGHTDRTTERTETSSGMKRGEKSSSFASEYGICLRLFARSNRWSKMLRRQGSDNVYYDKALSRALEKIERKYVTFIVWLIGCLLCFVPVFMSADIGICALAACGFTVLHLFLIAPFIYWKSLPRPIGAHIKSTEELNAFEKMQHEEEIAKDPHFDRLMRKYSSDDENYFTDEDSPLYKLVRKK